MVIITVWEWLSSTCGNACCLHMITVSPCNMYAIYMYANDYHLYIYMARNLHGQLSCQHVCIYNHLWLSYIHVSIRSDMHLSCQYHMYDPLHVFMVMIVTSYGNTCIIMLQHVR